MVFSKSEQTYYGLTDADLTTVEQKLIKVGETVYEKALQLMNYGNLEDDVLASAFAMEELFEFNREFSQESLIGESFIMYPQGYELKLFSYDAYLRMILSNATGEALQPSNNESTKSIYTRISDNTSILFSIALVILDAICVYIIPAIRVFFLAIVFILMLMLIIVSCLSLKENIAKNIFKCLIIPLLKFTAISIGLVFVTSLFMSDGATGVTGDSALISVGDPTMAIFIMLAINVVATILYWKLSKKTFKNFVEYAKLIGINIAGAVGGAFKKMGTFLGGAAIGATIAGAGRRVRRGGSALGGLASRGRQQISNMRGGSGGGSSSGSSGSGSGGSGGSGGAGGALAAGMAGGAAGAGLAGLGSGPGLASTKKEQKEAKRSAKDFEDRITAGEKNIEKENNRATDLGYKKRLASEGSIKERQNIRQEQFDEYAKNHKGKVGLALAKLKQDAGNMRDTFRRTDKDGNLKHKTKQKKLDTIGRKEQEAKNRALGMRGKVNNLREGAAAQYQRLGDTDKVIGHLKKGSGDAQNRAIDLILDGNKSKGKTEHSITDALRTTMARNETAAFFEKNGDRMMANEIRHGERDNLIKK